MCEMFEEIEYNLQGVNYIILIVEKTDRSV